METVNAVCVNILDTGLCAVHMNKHLSLLSTKTRSVCLCVWLQAVGDPRRLALRWSRQRVFVLERGNEFVHLSTEGFQANLIMRCAQRYNKSSRDRREVKHSA